MPSLIPNFEYPDFIGAGLPADLSAGASAEAEALTKEGDIKSFYI